MRGGDVEAVTRAHLALLEGPARQPDGLAKTALRLPEYRKLAPGPVEEIVFFDHPSGRTRIRMAMRWTKDHVPGATIAKPDLVPPM